MSTIVTRASKGSALAYTEVDSNFTNLNADKLEASTTATLTNKTISGASNTITNIGNSSLTNSSVTIGSTSVALGATAATIAGLTVTNPTINNYTEGLVAIGNTGTAQTLSLTNGTVQTATLTGNCTFTMPTATAGKSFLLFLSTGAGGFTGTFTSVKWSGGTAPTITTTASKVDILTFTSDGTSWYGTAVQNF